MADPDIKVWWTNGRAMFMTKRPAHEATEHLYWFIENELHIDEFLVTPTHVGFLDEQSITLFHLKYYAK